MNNCEICKETHECRVCKKQTTCDTYKWACPWKNGDEIQMCDKCLLQLEADLEAGRQMAFKQLGMQSVLYSKLGL